MKEEKKERVTKRCSGVKRNERTRERRERVRGKRKGNEWGKKLKKKSDERRAT